MEKMIPTTVFESFASSVRLDVFFLLVKRGPQGFVAGEIAKNIELLTVAQESRFQRYRANIPLAVELIDDLTAQYCSGMPDQCTDPSTLTACSPCAPSTLAEQRATFKA